MTTKFKVHHVTDRKDQAEEIADAIKGVVFRCRDIKKRFWTLAMKDCPGGFVVCRIDSI